MKEEQHRPADQVNQRKSMMQQSISLVHASLVHWMLTHSLYLMSRAMRPASIFWSIKLKTHRSTSLGPPTLETGALDMDCMCWVPHVLINANTSQQIWLLVVDTLISNAGSILRTCWFLKTNTVNNIVLKRGDRTEILSLIPVKGYRMSLMGRGVGECIGADTVSLVLLYCFRQWSITNATKVLKYTKLPNTVVTKVWTSQPHLHTMYIHRNLCDVNILLISHHTSNFKFHHEDENNEPIKFDTTVYCIPDHIKEISFKLTTVNTVSYLSAFLESHVLGKMVDEMDTWKRKS